MVTEDKEKNDSEKHKESKHEEKNKVSTPVIIVHPPNLPLVEEEQDKVQPNTNNLLQMIQPTFNHDAIADGSVVANAATLNDRNRFKQESHWCDNYSAFI